MGEIYALNTVHVSGEKSGSPVKKECEANRTDSLPEISFVYEDYRVRVFFSGNKTLTQCMKNLISRKQMG